MKANTDSKCQLPCVYTHTWERHRESTLREKSVAGVPEAVHSVHSNVLAAPAAALNPVLLVSALTLAVHQRLLAPSLLLDTDCSQHRKHQRDVRRDQAGSWSKPEENCSLEGKTGDVIEDLAQQMKRWVEQYSKLYTRENVVNENAI